MKTIAIATLLGLFLSTSALASNSGNAQQVKSYTSKAANSYVFVNRIASPIDKSATKVPTTAAEQLSKQL
ncbi:hypothetical protein [Pantoea sp. BAV 3049]|uniref:hypothetical protein n=1 Tax=Pantoea sp. BAV 3049 TaxID=2654188 RepID=UPI00131B13E0|nr:hypothetical protein [Pantoea sp. BAV 3049]